MTIALVLAAWFVLSVPAGIYVGRALAEGSDVLPTGGAEPNE